MKSCKLCGATGHVAKARFVQNYRQASGAQVLVDWWRCQACGGYFAHPIPDREVIASNWGTVSYQDPSLINLISANKAPLFTTIATWAAELGLAGMALDLGCGHGALLERLRSHGWKVHGMDANPDAVASCRARGIEASLGWGLSNATDADGSFDLITMVDVFCYADAPDEELARAFRLLKAGGALAMRVTNKNWLVRAVEACVPLAGLRGRLISRILLDQFHSLAVGQLSRILTMIGFESVRVMACAPTAPPETSRWSTRLAYGMADAVAALSAGRLNVYPGSLLLAVKGRLRG